MTLRKMSRGEALDLLREARRLDALHRETGLVFSDYRVVRDDIVATLEYLDFPSDYSVYTDPSEV